MALEITEQNGAVERKILSGLILSKSILGRISSRWDGKLFRSPICNQIASLCVDFYKKHGSSPNGSMSSLYESWATQQNDHKRVSDIGSFLEGLDHEYSTSTEGDLNTELLIDIADKHFRQVRQENLNRDIANALALNDLDRVDKLLSDYRKVELGVGAGINLFTDPEEIKSLFEYDHSEILIQYSGHLGEFFGHDLSRDSFVAIEGPAKSGKSHWLQDFAYQAMLSRRKVVYLEAGDLSKIQVERRFMVKCAQHPFRSSNSKDPYWPCTVKIPSEMTVVRDIKSKRKKAEITSYRERTFDKPLDHLTALAACERVMTKKVRSKQSYFKLSVYSNSSLSIDGIKTLLDCWAQDEFYPDVIIIDYADIMAPPNGAKDDRDSINKNWQQLRKLSQDLHCLVITGTQTDTDSYNQDIISKVNFSGDRRKNDHVTAMYGINTTDDEKKRGVSRLNVVVRRDGESYNKRCIYVAQCLALGRPAVLSSW